MMSYLSVAAGGAIGSALRFALGSAMQRAVGVGFPVGTLIVNVMGCGAMGVLYVWLIERSHAAPAWRALLLTGLLGGFTTFSAFSIETVSLIEAGEVAKGLVYVLASVLLCLLACWAGLMAARGA